MASYTLHRLPWYCPRDRLPAPLPHQRVILRQKDAFGRLGHDHPLDAPGPIIVFMGPYAIKYGTTVRQMEGENMLFVRANTTMPVPQLYAMEFYGPGDGRLHRAERQRIGLELASHVEQLRRIRAAPDYYGALGCNPIHSKGLSASVGPSDSHLRFAEDFFNLMKRAASSRRKKRFAAALHEVALRKRSGYPVFTHGDLHGRNVIVRANGKACIIDYELSGFMPAWYEFAFKGGVFDKLGMDYGRGFREERVILDSFHEYSH